MRPPLVAQQEAADCGPAALLSVLRFHGGDTTLQRLRALAGTGPDGSTLDGLATAARALAFTAEGARGDYEALREVDLPCIAHGIRGNGLDHFVAVYEAGPSMVTIMDPASGVASIPVEEFTEFWCEGFVLLLQPERELLHEAATPWVQWLASHLGGAQTWLIQAAFLGLLSTVLSFSTALFVQGVVDRFLPRKDVALLLLSAVLLSGVMIAKGAIDVLRARFLARLREEVGGSMLAELVHRLFGLPAEFFDRRKAGDIAARLDDAVLIQEATILFAGGAVTDLVVVTGAVLGSFVFSRDLGWLVLGAMAIQGLLVARSTRGIQAQQRKVLESHGEFRARAVDGILGESEIRAYGARASVSGANSKLIGHFQAAVRELQITRAAVSVLADTSGGVLITATLAFGAMLVMAGDLPLGSTLAVYALLASGLPSVRRLAEMHVAGRQASAAADRLYDVLGQDPEDTKAGGDFVMRTSISLREVTFGWPGAPPLLSRFSAEVRVGEILGIVGPNGSGKSTVARLLQRTYEPQEGRLLVDGMSADQVSLASWRQQVAIVPGDVRPAHGSLAENILMGRNANKLVPLMARLDSAGLGRFFERFPRGLGTVIGEAGRRLSLGERQYLALARALLGTPSVLIIDEGLNGLDGETSQRVWGLLEDYARENAVVVVSHDCRYLRRCHRTMSLAHNSMAPVAVDDPVPMGAAS